MADNQAEFVPDPHIRFVVSQAHVSRRGSKKKETAIGSTRALTPGEIVYVKDHKVVARVIVGEQIWANGHGYYVHRFHNSPPDTKVQKLQR